MTAKIIPVEPFDLVVFGGTGDLARRKLLPALYYRDRDGQLPPDSRIMRLRPQRAGREAYVAQIDAALRQHVDAADLDEACLARFLDRLRHIAVDALRPSGFDALAAELTEQQRVRVFYLATAPDLFGPICRELAACRLNRRTARVVLEKPIGRDLASARAINDEVGAVFAEPATFRIDHYLGKETVQNLMVLRFANSLFEPLWNSGAIDHVQITVAETIGVETRAAYYDQWARSATWYRTISFSCSASSRWRRRPASMLTRCATRSSRCCTRCALIRGADVGVKTVRGQYRAGATHDGGMPGYLEELGHSQRHRDLRRARRDRQLALGRRALLPAAPASVSPPGAPRS